MLPGSPGAVHLGGDAQRAPHVGAGRRADPAPEHALQRASGGDRRRVRNRDHPVDHVGKKARLHPRPADALDARPDAGDQVRRMVAPRGEERGVVRVDHREPGLVPAVAQVASDRRAGAAGAGADHDPGRHRVRLQRHLREDRLGDVVVAAPVGGALGIGELVEIVAAALAGQPRGLGVHRRRVVDEVAAAALVFDQRDLARAGGAWHHGHEAQAEQPREVGLADRGGPGRRLDDRGGRPDPAVAQTVEEQRTRQPVLQRPGRVRRLVLQVDLDAGERRERQRYEVRVGRTVRVGLDPPHGIVRPRAGGRVTSVHIGSPHGHRTLLVRHQPLTRSGHRACRERAGSSWLRRTARRWRTGRRRTTRSSGGRPTCARRGGTVRCRSGSAI